MKQTPLCLLLLALMFPVLSSAQRVYSRRLTVSQGEYIHDIEGSSDGGLYMLYTQNNVYGLCKTDALGNLQWSKLITPGAGKLEVAANGNVFTSSGGVLSKFTGAGVPVWAISLSFSITDFDVADDGEIFCTGGNKVCKLDSNGAVLWGETLYDINQTVDIVASVAGGAYIAANARSSIAEFKRGTLVKVSDLGAVAWSRQAQALYMSFFRVVETPDMQVSVAAVEPNSTYTATRLFRFDASGTPLWNSMIGPVRYHDAVSDMTATSNNGVAITGVSSDGPLFFYKDVFVYWVSSTGAGIAAFPNMQYGSLGTQIPMFPRISTTSDGLLAYAYSESDGYVTSHKAWYGKLSAIGSSCKPRTNASTLWNAVTNPVSVVPNAISVTVTPMTATATASSLQVDSLCSYCTTPATAAFSTASSGLDVTVTNSSTQALSYTWDWGDGSSSTTASPTHTYAQAGTYTVCLTAIGACDQDSACRTVTVVDPIISGTIRHPNLLSTIRSTTVALSGTTAGSLTTGLDGEYAFTVSNGGNYTLTPSKSNDTTTNNGVTTIDVILMQRHILQQDTLDSPYKILAADVNNSSSITTLDIVLTRALILQTNLTFPGGRLWSMVDASHVFVDSIHPWPFPSTRTYPSASTFSNQDFYGVKLGDVNWSWNPATPKTDAVGAIKVDFGALEAQQGEEILVPIKVEGFEDISGYQFTVTWDPAILAYQGHEAAATQAHFGTSRTAEGILIVSWNEEAGGAVTLADGAAIFSLRFKAVGAAGMRSTIAANSSLIPGEAYNRDLDVLDIVARESSVTIHDGLAPAHPLLQWVQSAPNPFQTMAMLRFSLAAPAHVRCTVTDLRGVLIATFESPYPAGAHALEWPGASKAGDALPAGTYLLRMEAGGESRTIRMVHMRP